MSSTSHVIHVSRVPYASLNFSCPPFDAVKEVESSLFSLSFISIASFFSIEPSRNKFAPVHFLYQFIRILIFKRYWPCFIFFTTSFKIFIFFFKSLCILQDIGCTNFPSVKVYHNPPTSQFRVFACVLAFRFLRAESWNSEQDIFPSFSNALEGNPHKHNVQVHSNIVARFSALDSLATLKKLKKSNIIALFQEVKQSSSWKCL